jgi:hypothetical protein
VPIARPHTGSKQPDLPQEGGILLNCRQLHLPSAGEVARFWVRASYSILTLQILICNLSLINTVSVRKGD